MEQNPKQDQYIEKIEISEEPPVETPETQSVAKPRRDYFLPLSILLAGVMISGSVIYAVGYSRRATPAVKQNSQAGTVSAVPELGGRDVVLGDPKAPITLIEYGDYQCPYCHQFFSQYEQKIRDTYIKTGQVKMVYRNYMVIDLMSKGTESHNAALAAECAKDQNKFWAYHDALMNAEIKDGKEANGNITRSFLMQVANDAKLDPNGFSQCYDSQKYTQNIQAEMDAGEKAGVQGTPTFFVNGSQVQDPFSAIEGLVSESQ